MSRALLLLLTLAALGADFVTAQSGRAQQVRSRNRGAVAVHEAWLQENLDLDAQGAIQSYEALRRAAPSARPERWIAVSRLAELGRLGALRPEPGTTPMQAPPEVQSALEALGQPVPWRSVLDDPRAPIELPRLRPATEQVMRWSRDQVGPTVDQRWMMQMRTRDRAPRGNTRWRNRNAAFTLLDVELEGTPERAESLRRLLFVGWKPPVLDVGVEVALQRARKRLRELVETETRSSYRRRLESLELRVRQLEGDDPREALSLLMRLPFLAEELLLPASEQETSERDGR